ncbi:MAG: substrate-binding domain-containing protein [Chloroflexota bacterium]
MTTLQLTRQCRTAERTKHHRAAHRLPRFSIVIGLTLLSTGCSQPPEPTLPPPVPQVTVAPSLEGTVAAWIRAYREDVGVPGFDLVPRPEEAGIEAMRRGEAALAISLLDPPDGWFATPLATEAIVVVVHPSNPVRDLSLDDLADLFTGRIADWSALGGETVPVQLLVPTPEDGLRQRFEAVVLDEASVWPGARIAPSPEAIVSLAQADRGAIGYLPLSQVVSGLRVLRLDGVDPEAASLAGGRYPLTFTIVATAPEEPTSAVRDWLVWLQATYPIVP